MKHNWTYRPFMECIENVKYTTKLQTKDFAEQGTYPVISQDESYISGYWDNADDVFHAKRPLVIFGDHTRVLKYIDFDFVLGADGVKILLPTEDILAKYMYYYLKWYNVPSLGYSRHFKLLRDIELPIPSLDEQQAIVRELDGINHLIDLQEEQLREYDRLAQSLFYTAFGDPVSNPKGWEVKKFGDILSYIKNGANIKQTKGAGGLPITRIETLSGGVFNRDRLGYADITDQLKYANFYLETGDLLMSHINSKTYIGRTVMYEKEGNETIIHGMNLLRLKVIRDMVNPVFVCYYCKTDRFKGDVAKIRKDAVNQSSICISDIVRLSLPVPPLELQQSFAAQIEAIEQQKALIRRSLDDTRTLLAARMQYYFE